MMTQCHNPYLPLHEYIPDGEPYVFDGRLYILEAMIWKTEKSFVNWIMQCGLHQ